MHLQVIFRHLFSHFCLISLTLFMFLYLFSSLSVTFSAYLALSLFPSLFLSVPVDCIRIFLSPSDVTWKFVYKNLFFFRILRSAFFLVFYARFKSIKNIHLFYLYIMMNWCLFRCAVCGKEMYQDRLGKHAELNHKVRKIRWNLSYLQDWICIDFCYYSY